MGCGGEWMLQRGFGNREPNHLYEDGTSIDNMNIHEHNVYVVCRWVPKFKLRTYQYGEMVMNPVVTESINQNNMNIHGT